MKSISSLLHVLPRRLAGLAAALCLSLQIFPAWGDVYYIHSDHLDTPRAVTNAQNQVIWQNPPLTEPFGSGAPDEDPDGDATPFTLNLRFPGQYFDPETNAHYNYYRDHYFPSLGRYGQSDPIGLLGGINTYGYVRGSPLLWGDPRGLLTCGSGWNDYVVPDNPLECPFSDCCQAHDDCYGDTCNKPDKEECDNNFHQCMLEICRDQPLWKRSICNGVANFYFNVVSRNGEAPFRRARGLPIVPQTKYDGETSDY
jgi:RHS repeat-associated protein